MKFTHILVPIDEIDKIQARDKPDWKLMTVNIVDYLFHVAPKVDLSEEGIRVKAEALYGDMDGTRIEVDAYIQCKDDLLNPES